MNTSIPIVVKILLSFEKHYDEGSKEKSLYVMITFFRWMNTAVVLRLITPILASIGQQKIDLINTVNSLMISEMVVSPMIRYVDPGSFLKRHILAPRAKSEEAMLRCFDGGYYSLAERFTDFTKVLLLCIFYSGKKKLYYQSIANFKSFCLNESLRVKYSILSSCLFLGGGNIVPSILDG